MSPPARTPGSDRACAQRGCCLEIVEPARKHRADSVGNSCEPSDGMGRSLGAQSGGGSPGVRTATALAVEIQNDLEADEVDVLQDYADGIAFGKRPDVAPSSCGQGRALNANPIAQGLARKEPADVEVG